jgi:uncharacterized protein (TIGR02646 family)
LSLTEMKELAKARPHEPFMKYKGNNPWDYPPNDEVIAIKKKIRLDLTTSQKVCGFCGLRLKGTSQGQIEHIAPKAYYRHPEFTFTLKNLVLACHYCNSPDKKGTKDTISIKHTIYSKCKFNIVHPYLDDPEEHYDWTDKEIELLIQVKNDSPQGKKSIEIFGLDNPNMSELRAGEIRHSQLKAKYALLPADEFLLEAALSK